MQLNNIVKPSVFIATSSESELVGLAVLENLEKLCEPTLWSHDVFEPSNSNLTSLLKASKNFDFAVIIYSADDKKIKRGDEIYSPRDNIIFESGLFLGSMGKKRVFIISDSSNDLDLPTDLLGISLLNYNSSRNDDRLVSATATACKRISIIIEKLGVRDVNIQKAPYSSSVCYKHIENETVYGLVKTTRDRWIFPKGRILAGESSQIAALRYAEDEGGMRGRIDLRETKNANIYKEDRANEQLVEFQLVRVTSETEPLESFRNPSWFNYNEAVEKISEGRSYKYSQPIIDILDWASLEIENKVSDRVFLAGGLPYRIKDDGNIEFLLVTSRTSKNWIAPKGHINASESSIDAASREAFEEAGVGGAIKSSPIGSYIYRRLSKEYVVDMFPIEVSSLDEVWPESNSRDRRWFNRSTAVEVVNEMGLSELIENFQP